uniref:Uncharacterized protein n=1 Tax=Physcomitrium patens TaxID=3218 RepID=A0A7I4BAN1_PHYPA
MGVLAKRSDKTSTVSEIGPNLTLCRDSVINNSGRKDRNGEAVRLRGYASGFDTSSIQTMFQSEPGRTGHKQGRAKGKRSALVRRLSQAVGIAVFGRRLLISIRRSSKVALHVVQSLPYLGVLFCRWLSSSSLWWRPRILHVQLCRHGRVDETILLAALSFCSM